MTQQPNIATELRSLVQRQFGYMPEIVRKELHCDLLDSLADWIETYRALEKDAVEQSRKQVADIESFLVSLGNQGMTGPLYIPDVSDIDGIIDDMKEGTDEKKVCD
jgi:hypothetical protein